MRRLIEVLFDCDPAKSFTAKDAEDAKENEKLYREGNNNKKFKNNP